MGSPPFKSQAHSRAARNIYSLLLWRTGFDHFAHWGIGAFVLRALKQQPVVRFSLDSRNAPDEPRERSTVFAHVVKGVIHVSINGRAFEIPENEWTSADEQRLRLNGRYGGRRLPQHKERTLHDRIEQAIIHAGWGCARNYYFPYPEDEVRGKGSGFYLDLLAWHPHDVSAKAGIEIKAKGTQQAMATALGQALFYRTFVAGVSGVCVPRDVYWKLPQSTLEVYCRSGIEIVPAEGIASWLQEVLAGETLAAA